MPNDGRLSGWKNTTKPTSCSCVKARKIATDTLAPEMATSMDETDIADEHILLIDITNFKFAAFSNLLKCLC